MADEQAGDRRRSAAGGIDTSVAHPARVYDYWLGGKDNFAADREAAERVLAVTPGLRFRVQANRAFLARAVRYLAAEAGIRQFLDIGTGIPSANNTHEVAQAVAPDSRIVYVDNDHRLPGCAHASTTVGDRPVSTSTARVSPTRVGARLVDVDSGRLRRVAGIGRVRRLANANANDANAALYAEARGGVRVREPCTNHDYASHT